MDRATAGVVLTGGASRRMGVNKATLLVDGQPLALRVAGVLAAAGCAPIWFQGGDVAELGVLASSGKVRGDQVPGRGPVGAIASILEFASKSIAAEVSVDGVLIAACDLIDLDVETVKSVIDGGREGVVSVAAAPGPANGESSQRRSSHRESRPWRWHLLSWWSLELAEPVAQAVEAGVTSYHELLDSLGRQRIVDGGIVNTINVSPTAVRNVNTPSDLQRWERR